MAKEKRYFECQGCGAGYRQWQGQCAQCGDWNQILETVPVAAPVAQRGYAGVAAELTTLSAVQIEVKSRIPTGMDEFDRVLGGGLVADSVVLVGGDPGIGKSTLLLQLVLKLAATDRILYVTGEESLSQVAERARRLGAKNEPLNLYAETEVERILATLEQYAPKVVVIDSIQTIFSSSLTAAAGSVSQVKESAAQLVRYAKQRGVALLLVGHVTKEGTIAGPRVLEHMVDTVLYFEGQGHQRFRVIRAVKNRFGAVNEIAVLAMSDQGLKQVQNPSAMFLSRSATLAPGSLVSVIWEGSRPLLVEVQALVDETAMENPRRVTVGMDTNRLAMLLAVLSRHGRVPTHARDVFFNVVGGLRILETGADLAVLLAVVSSIKNAPVPSGCLVFGEVGLSGEIRPVAGGIERIKEASKHGFTRAIVPRANAPKTAVPGIVVEAVDHIKEAVQALWQ